MLPTTVDEIRNGGVYLQYVRCGKKNCRCANGQRHKAHYLFLREKGKMRKVYVPAHRVEGIKDLIEQARTNRQNKRLASKQSTTKLSSLRVILRDCELIVSRRKALR
jgi:hypothetical protein